MSKAILVMDMPDSCFHCDCCHEKPYDNRYRIEGEKFCGIEDMEVDKYYDSFYSEEPMRPSWCPLKELPKKEKMVLQRLDLMNIAMVLQKDLMFVWMKYITWNKSLDLSEEWRCINVLCR